MMKDERWKLLIATSDESEVSLVKHHLEAEGILARIEVKTHFAGADNAGRGKRYFLYVGLGDFETGQQIMEDTDQEEEAR